jgi:hypothetical protein
MTKTKATNFFTSLTLPPPLPPSQHPVLWIDDILVEETKQLLLRSKSETEAQAAYKALQTQCISDAYWQGVQDAGSPALVERFHAHPFLLKQGVTNSALLAAYLEGLKAGLKEDPKPLPLWRRKDDLILLGVKGLTYLMLSATVYLILHALGWL